MSRRSRDRGGQHGQGGGVGGRVALALGVGALAGGLARAVIDRARHLNLCGKVVLITGGSRGLGLVLARQLVERGARVAICARDGDELERATRDLESRGGDVQPVLCDVTDRQRVQAMIRDVESGTGPIDILINNAGVIGVGPIEEMSIQDFEQEMATHFWGPLYAILEVLPRMRARRAGRICNIGSIGGKVPVPHLSGYCASKFALAGLSGALRAELLRDGVYVTAIHPTLMRTGSHIQARFKGNVRAEYALFTWSIAAPGASMRAERAAARILRAIQRGEAEAIVGVQALAAAKLYQLAPEWTSDALSLIGAMLPRATRPPRTNRSRRPVKGRNARSRASDAAESFAGLTGAVELYGQSPGPAEP